MIILPLGTQLKVESVEMELHERIVDSMIIIGSVAHLVSPIIEADVIVAILVRQSSLGGIERLVSQFCLGLYTSAQTQ